MVSTGTGELHSAQGVRADDLGRTSVEEFVLRAVKLNETLRVEGNHRHPQAHAVPAPLSLEVRARVALQHERENAIRTLRIAPASWTPSFQVRLASG